MVPSVCGLSCLLQFILHNNSTTILGHGIGTELPHARTEKRKESEWEMPSLRASSKKLSVSKLLNGDGCLTITTQSEEDYHLVWVTLMMSDPCTFQHVTESTGMSNTTDTGLENKKPQWFKDDLFIKPNNLLLYSNNFLMSLILKYKRNKALTQNQINKLNNKKSNNLYVWNFV